MPIEPISLTIGVVALASLFSTCIQCFELVEAGRSYARDYQLLLVKLQIEKTRLLIWGEAARLLSADDEHNASFGNSLDKPWIRNTVADILSCLMVVFEDTDALRSKYGLVPMQQKDLESHDDIIEVSRNQTVSFKQRHQAFQSRLHLGQKKAGVLSQSRWAIHDRAKFIDLVKDLKDLIDGLKDVTPDLKPIWADAIKHEIDQIDEESLHYIQEACAGTHEDWSDAVSIRLETLTVSDRGALHIAEWVDSVPIAASNLETTSDSNLPMYAEQHQWKTFVIALKEDSWKRFNSEDLIALSHEKPIDIDTSLGSGTGYALGSTVRPGHPRSPHRDDQPIVIFYCAPCIKYLRTAWALLRDFHRLRGLIRVDDRLDPNLLDGNPRRRAIPIRAVCEYKGTKLKSKLDMSWHKQRLQVLETAVADFHPINPLSIDAYYKLSKETAKCAGMVILAEVFQCRVLINDFPLRCHWVSDRHIFEIKQEMVDDHGKASPEFIWVPEYWSKLKIAERKRRLAYKVIEVVENIH